ncbi:hypothetical protein K4L44_07975 [Halosquirtibacter laminarini]|uniref:Uncharacterized protein n=1 Tax=Halosquirtibacter laminarini TaxID=3374600 RepID=A0AC61NRC4_9BACT|nr:hypothetical protein K4L44_07975 [Prolixibacteraceae bacterium]
MAEKDNSVQNRISSIYIEEMRHEIVLEQASVKLQELVGSIAESLTADFICFLNPETLEIEEVPKDFLYDFEELEAVVGESIVSDGLKHVAWQSCITMEPMESEESFHMMANFVKEVENISLQADLVEALSRKRPFAHFKSIIDGSGYRQQWFDFRQKQTALYVWDMIHDAIADEYS